MNSDTSIKSGAGQTEVDDRKTPTRNTQPVTLATPRQDAAMYDAHGASNVAPSDCEDGFCDLDQSGRRMWQVLATQAVLARVAVPERVRCTWTGRGIFLGCLLRPDRTRKACDVFSGRRAVTKEGLRAYSRDGEILRGSERERSNGEKETRENNGGSSKERGTAER